MLLTRALPAVGFLTFAAYLVPAFTADAPPTPAKSVRLPLTRVVLFTAGVGYFHREGTVDGTARVDVRVPEEDVNDLIKTLVATDKGGTPRAVTYDNKAPAEVTLKAFQIDLTENPSVADLLAQVRGEKVEITIDKPGKTTVGTIVSVVKPEVEISDTRAVDAAGEETGKQVTVRTLPNLQMVVNLLTENGGIEGVPLAKVKAVRFVKPELQAEFRKALEAVAEARGAATKTVGVTFAGAGKRPVSLGYVTEAPLWKPTYRIALDGTGAKVEGWVAVENTTDDDWENVKLSLVSGRPMTFQMDLYDPLYVPRPLIEPELYASLRPPIYQGNVSRGQANFLGGFGGGGFGGGGGGQLGNGATANLGVGGGVLGMTGGSMGQAAPSQTPRTSGGLTRPSVRSLSGIRLTYDELRERLSEAQQPADKTATDAMNARGPGGATADFGQSFRYELPDPVSLPRFKSALLPVVNETAGVERVSIYNSTILESHPMLGVRLANKAKQFLAQGPVAVYDGGTYAGDARLPDVKPGETRLMSYAVDLDVRVDQHDGPSARKTDGVWIRVSHPTEPSRTAVLFKREVVRQDAIYTVRNDSNTPRTVLITRPITHGREIVGPAKPTDETADLHRFEVKVGQRAEAKLTVTERWDETSDLKLIQTSDATFDDYIGSADTPAAVKAALTRVKTDRAKLAATEADVAEEESALKAITDEQARMRSNIERVPKESQAFQRYLKKFDDQETEIEKRQARARELRKLLEKQKQTLDEMLKGLKAE